MSSPAAAPNPFCHLPHFVTGTYTRNKTFLDDDEYGRALDCFVKGCADILLTDEKGMMLMGKRKVHPQPDWWVLGGRMKAGDTPEEAAGRNCKRETGVDIPPERWSFVCCHTMLWQFRKQAPEGNGTADFGVIMTAVVTEEEREDDHVQRGVRGVRLVRPRGPAQARVRHQAPPRAPPGCQRTRQEKNQRRVARAPS